MTPKVNIKRTLFKGGETGPGPVVYWMSRDQRIQDNWALLYAEQIALEKKSPLCVVFCLFTPNYLNAPLRHYDFMIGGLKQVESNLAPLNIPFYLLTGKPEEEIPAFLKRVKAGALVTDFNPLKINREWKEKVRQKTSLAYYVVDAHNIVPCWVASQKQEFGAYTIRPKITKLLGEYLEEFPKLSKHPFDFPEAKGGGDWQKALAALKLDSSVPAVDWIKPGEKEALSALGNFIQQRLPDYNEGRNDPAGLGQSDLSPYFHFGQLAPQRAALEVSSLSFPRYLDKLEGKRESTDPRLKSCGDDKRIEKTKSQNGNSESFLEELIVRRELSDNYCFFNKNYDNFEGFPDWAKVTLNAHRTDPRMHLYSREKLERAVTHDIYWNAAQIQMVKSGKMHGYMRMYWAKKILEWTKSPEEAQEIAIYLNDKYELDGRDSNGYTGIAWSIGGVHDRAWTERPIFGKIRFMNAAGLERKFEMDRYVSQWDNNRLL